MVLLIKNGARADSGPGVSQRLGDHFLARLVHAARAAAVEQALSDGLLAEADPEKQSEKAKSAKTRAGSSFTIADFGLDADHDGYDGRTVSPRGRCLRLGPRLEGLAGPDLARMLKRAGIPLGLPDSAACKMDDDGALAAAVLKAVRVNAPPPGAADVATLLLLASAFAGRGSSMTRCLAPLRQPQPIVSLLCPVEGFESNMLILLRAGLVLPGRAATSDGYDLRWRNDIRFRGSDEARREVVVFRGKRHDDSEPDAVRRQVGIAAQAGYPILGIAEAEDRLPDSLRIAAGLSLEAGPLSLGIVSDTMDAVLGETADEMELLEKHCHRLTLSDIGVAIRPGVDAERALQVLCQLAAARSDSQGEDSSSGGSGRSGGGSSSGRNSSSSSSRRGSDQTTGSEVIRPVKLMTPGDVDAFTPRVETLSGYGDAKDWALALKEDLGLWRSGELRWDEMSVKLLLSGPPGTGKTTFARALCNTLQVPLIATSVATWLEPGYLGDVIKRMRRAFEEAASHAPSILFIDEIDGIARRTSDGRSHEDYWNSVVNKMLELLDGTTRSDGVIIVGATNHPDAIDPALRRSGRLEKHIVIPRPDTDALIGILRHHLRQDVGHVIATRPASKALEHRHRDVPGRQGNDNGDTDGHSDCPLDGNAPRAGDAEVERGVETTTGNEQDSRKDDARNTCVSASGRMSPMTKGAA